MTQSYVLDTHAYCCYILKEKGWEKVEKALLSADEQNQKLWMSVVNWGELYYQFVRDLGLEKTESYLRESFDVLPIQLVNVDQAHAKQAAFYKANKKMSYADCFAAALSKIKHAPLITGDPEFKEVGKEINILWIR